MKTAYLLTFHATTRVVVDSENNPWVDEELFAKMCERARSNMTRDIDSYLMNDNAEIEEDKEMPYTPGYDDPNEDVFVKG